MTAHDKDKMKQVMLKLAENKTKNGNITVKLDSIAQIHLKKKTIKKENHKNNKNI